MTFSRPQDLVPLAVKWISRLLDHHVLAGAGSGCDGVEDLFRGGRDVAVERNRVDTAPLGPSDRGRDAIASAGISI